MDTVPDEILIEIFSYLSSKEILRCSMVSERWCQLSKDPSLWRVVDFSSTKIPIRTLARFLNRGVQNLNLQLATVEDPVSWGRLFFSNKLRSLDLTCATISRRSLGQLLRSCTELECLHLQYCEINHIAYKAIAANSNLKVLSLRNCAKLPAHGYETIFKDCQMLDDANLSDTESLYARIDSIKSPNLRRLAVANSQLEYLEVKDLVRQCPNLTHLDISGNFVGPIGMEKIKKLLPNIVELVNFQRSDFEEVDEDFMSDYDTDWEDANEESDMDEQN